MSYKAHPDTWPKGGPSEGRMHVTTYTKPNGVERLQVVLSMDQGRAISAGDPAAAEAMLEAVASKVARLESGKVSK